ncbi:MAG: pyridoxamine 5'-phosphate oxidase [Bacteroidia bacterium]
MQLHTWRREYTREPLEIESFPDEPMEKVKAWVEEAAQAEELEPNAFALATLGEYPSVRFVLVKEITAEGIVFYTNYESEKGHQLGAIPRAGACFWWAKLERQLRMEGEVEKVSAQQSDAYFAVRPYLSQVGAWASPQSQVIPSRAWLEKRFETYQAQYPEGNVPRPAFWGGYLIRPRRVEFWQGQRNRLHDRIVYLASAGGWEKKRLAP